MQIAVPTLPARAPSPDQLLSNIAQRRSQGSSDPSSTATSPDSYLNSAKLQPAKRVSIFQPVRSASVAPLASRSTTKPPPIPRHSQDSASDVESMPIGPETAASETFSRNLNHTVSPKSIDFEQVPMVVPQQSQAALAVPAVPAIPAIPSLPAVPAVPAIPMLTTLPPSMLYAPVDIPAPPPMFRPPPPPKPRSSTHLQTSRSLSPTDDRKSSRPPQNVILPTRPVRSPSLDSVYKTLHSARRTSISVADAIAYKSASAQGTSPITRPLSSLASYNFDPLPAPAPPFPWSAMDSTEAAKTLPPADLQKIVLEAMQEMSNSPQELLPSGFTELQSEIGKRTEEVVSVQGAFPPVALPFGCC